MTRDEFLKLESEEEQLNYIQERLHLEILPKVCEYTDPKSNLIGIVKSNRPDSRGVQFAYIFPVDCLTGKEVSSFFEGSRNISLRCKIDKLSPDSLRIGQYVHVSYQLDVAHMQKQIEFLPLALVETVPMNLTLSGLKTFVRLGAPRN